jgi:hypothetical protein
VFVLIPEHEGRALAAIHRGGTFGEICAGLADVMEPAGAASAAAAMLLGWLERGVVGSLAEAGQAITSTRKQLPVPR